MYVTNKQLVDLVLPILDTACEVWQDRVRGAIERGEGLELSGCSIDTAAWWASANGHVECLRLSIAAGLSRAGRDVAAWRARWERNLECLKLLEAAKTREERP